MSIAIEVLGRSTNYIPEPCSTVFTKCYVEIESDYPVEPKARPRLGKSGNVYSPTQGNERSLAWVIRAQAGAWSTSKPVRIVFRVGYSRGDLDNYVKTILDALQKSGVVKNDSQVIMITASKRSRNGFFLSVEETTEDE